MILLARALRDAPVALADEIKTALVGDEPQRALPPLLTDLLAAAELLPKQVSVFSSYQRCFWDSACETRIGIHAEHWLVAVCAETRRQYEQPEPRAICSKRTVTTLCFDTLRSLAPI
jgi:hypothetical protein